MVFLTHLADKLHVFKHDLGLFKIARQKIQRFGIVLVYAVISSDAEIDTFSLSIVIVLLKLAM